MDRGSWQAAVQGVAKSQTQLGTHAQTRNDCYAAIKAGIEDELDEPVCRDLKHTLLNKM